MNWPRRPYPKILCRTRPDISRAPIDYANSFPLSRSNRSTVDDLKRFADGVDSKTSN
ncbi:hypothetical protein PGT21_036238 [Puccinia graminis f. sp. tritici]|uniref:Uncharacterized protein n=1 Tax=Puccinia graminis f. sp. tritici TaxID=56615 RepID=A0A5B0Q059_PUCGR|nr:hypothetical protein PGT21_036238 [Puccinia graminis f. sp. tritici]